MSVLQWNLRGYNSNGNDLRYMMRQHNIDIVLLQETKFTSEFSPKIPNFKVFSRNVVCNVNQIAHGGVSIFVRESFNPKRIFLDTPLQAVAVQIDLPEPTIFCSFYVQEKDNVSKSQVQSLVDQLGNRFVIAGDMNAHNPLWEHHQYNKLGEILEEIMNENNLNLLNNEEATYLNPRSGRWSILDLTFSSFNVVFDYEWQTIPDLSGSDHLPIKFQMLPKSRANWQVEKRFQEHKADWVKYTSKTSKICVLDLDQDSLNDFNNQVLAIAEKTIPMNSMKQHRKVVPWWNAEIDAAVRDRRRAFRRLKRNFNLKNVLNLNQVTARAKRLIKVAKRESTNNFCSSITPNTPIKSVYSNIKKIQGISSSSSVRALKVNNQLITDPRDIAEAMAEHFSAESSNNGYSERFRALKRLRERFPIEIPEIQNSINNDFSMQELEMALQKCKGKSVGINSISYSMYKNLHQDAKHSLLEIFNFMWNNRNYPKEWNHAITIPLQKPGKSPYDPDGKRPISLTCCDAKVFERIAMGRLNWWIEKNKKLSNNQNGFRRDRCITDNIVSLHTEIVQCLAIDEHAFCIFFDLRKAYDKVWRRIITQTLIDWGLGGNIVHFIDNFLNDRRMQVKINGSSSDIKILENGVPQGSVAAVTCFLIAIADFENDLNRDFEREFPGLTLHLISYADDKAAMISGKTNDKRMRPALQFVADFTKKWMSLRGLDLSPTKTQILHCCQKRNCKKVEVLIDDLVIKQQKNVRFLGHIFDNRLLWRQHILERKSKSLKAVGALKFFSKPSNGGNPQTMLRLSRSLISSRLLFGSEVYFGSANSNIQTLKSVYTNAIRLSIGAFRTSPHVSIIFQSGEFSFEHLMWGKNMNYCIRSLAYAHINDGKIMKVSGHAKLKTLGDFFNENFNKLNCDLSAIHSTNLGAPPWLFMHLKVNTELSRFDKESTPTSILRRHATHLINMNSESDLYYTDGSKKDDCAGYAIVTPNDVIKQRLQDNTDIYFAELTAIHGAILLVKESGRKSLIVTDSLASLRAIENPNNKDFLVKKIQQIAFSIGSSNVSFLFVHSHVGIPGNDMADEQAQQSLHLDSPSDLSLTYGICKKFVKRSLNQLKIDEWNGLDDANKLKGHVGLMPETGKCMYLNNRKESVLITRLRIGHTKFTHSYLFLSPRVIPICETCNVQITINHVLIDCPKYSQARVISQISDDLRTIFNPSQIYCRRLIEFIKLANLFHEV